jgi:hypothetical protein
MAKTKISEYDSLAANNTDVDGINIAENCPPSGINNAIREVMAHLKDFQSGTSGDTFTNTSTLNVTGNFHLDGSAGTSGQVLVSQGSGTTPIWGSGFPSGGIIMWAGTIATIHSGWYLCNGANGTPDLRNKFIIAAHADDGGAAKTNVTGSYAQSGGSKDAIVVSHTHTFSASTNTAGDHNHTISASGGEYAAGQQDHFTTDGVSVYSRNTGNAGSHSHTVSGTTASSGSSGTNANLPPYYALAYIMKG